MLRTYKFPEIPDQDKPDNGVLTFGLQKGNSINPLPFFATGNDSAIVSFTAVQFDQFRAEKNRISLDTSIINVDATNHIYNVDGLTNYTDFLENGIYRFEFENDTNKWTTEYFNVVNYSNQFSFTINTVLGAGNGMQLPLPSGVDYNFIVYWGDDSQDTITSYNQAETLHTYAAPFTGDILIAGTCEGWSFNNLGDKLKITSVNKLEDIGLKLVSGAFHGCTNLTTLNIGSWNTINVTDFSNFANGCLALTTLDAGGWNTKNVTDFNNFINTCQVLTFLNTSNWRTSNVTDFSFFAHNCFDLATLDVISWNTKNVTDFNNFARSCFDLIILNTVNWDTSNVTDFEQFARSCTSLTSFFEPTKFWTRPIPVPNFTNCFTGDLLISNYDDIPNVWKGLLPVFQFSFTIDTALGSGNSFQLPLPSTGNYNFIVYWGDGHQDTITAFDQVETLHNYTGSFAGQILIDGTCEGWSFNNLGDKLKITSVDELEDIGLKHVTGAFHGCTNLTILNIVDWDTIDVTDFSFFATQCTSLIILNTVNWDTSNVTDFEQFAAGCLSLTTLNVTNWGTGNVTNFNRFIVSCGNLLILDTTNWDTVSVSDFGHFAFSCSSLIILNTVNWDTDAVVSFIFFVFNCEDLTSFFEPTKFWTRTIPVPNFLNCFQDALLISNYAAIPNNWKGL